MEQPKKPNAKKSPWVIIYPIYLNDRKTIDEGRKVPLKYAGTNPTCSQIVEMCKQLGLQTELENDKAYPRDWMLKGRVKVKLLDDSFKPIKPDIPTKRKLMMRIGATLPKSGPLPQNTGGGKKKATKKNK